MTRHGKTYQRLMNSREWRALRQEKLRANPLCERCQAEGYVTAACCVHHIVEVESGRTDEDCRRLAYQWNNLQSLCYSCHAQIHRAERSHSKDIHREREATRLSQWIERNARRSATPAPDFLSDPPSVRNTLALSSVDGSDFQNPVLPTPQCAGTWQKSQSLERISHKNCESPLKRKINAET